MEKRISYDQFMSVKRVAQACNPLMVKRESLRKKIEKLAAEYKDYDTQISSLEAGIKQVVGFRVEELVKKVVEPGVDCNGQPKKSTKWLPTSIVSYDEQHKQYVITAPDAEGQPKSEEAPTDTASSDEANNIQEAVNDAADEVKDPVGEVGTPVESAVPTDALIFE